MGAVWRPALSALETAARLAIKELSRRLNRTENKTHTVAFLSYQAYPRHLHLKTSNNQPYHSKSPQKLEKQEGDFQFLIKNTKYIFLITRKTSTFLLGIKKREIQSKKVHNLGKFLLRSFKKCQNLTRRIFLS